MESRLILELLAIMVLILANGFFALSEFSIIASRKSKLRQDVEDKKPGAAIAEKLYNKPDKFLASIQIGITLFGTLAGVFGGATLVKQLEEWLNNVPIDFISSTSGTIAVAIVAITITIVAVLFGELVPKFLALSQPEKFARHVARPVNIFVIITSIFATALSSSANFIVRLFGVKHEKSRSPITEEEINMMIFEGRQKGVFDATEEKLIKSVFDFADSTVKRAMTPRTDVIGVELTTSVDKIINLIIEHGYSRYPVYEKDLDNIIGILYVKDIIVQKLNPELIIVKDLCHTATFVPDSMPLSKLLNELQLTKKHMAIVLDEFGGTAGIITFEDIIEELVGEIRDEYDFESEPLTKHSENVAYAEASVWPGAVNELINCNLPEDDVDTLAKLFIDTLGKLPENDDTIVVADVKMTALQIENNRILKIKIEKIENISNE